jgi:hypothetical protein
MDWFGAGSYGNDCGYGMVAIDHPFGTALIVNDKIDYTPTDTCLGASVYNLDLDATDVSNWSNLGRIHSFKHTFGQGRVFYYAGNPGYSEDPDPVLIENGLNLFEAGLLWAVSPIIQNIAFKGCISELCTSSIQVVASDPYGGSQTYNYEPLDGGTIIGSGSSVIFDSPAISQGYPCPYRVKVTVTSSESGLLTSQTIGIYVKISGDINGDGKVNATDKLLWKKRLGWEGTPGTIPEDINCDGKVDATDQSILSTRLGLGWGCVCK